MKSTVVNQRIQRVALQICCAITGVQKYRSVQDQLGVRELHAAQCSLLFEENNTTTSYIRSAAFPVWWGGGGRGLRWRSRPEQLD